MSTLNCFLVIAQVVIKVQIEVIPVEMCLQSQYIISDTGCLILKTGSTSTLNFLPDLPSLASLYSSKFTFDTDPLGVGLDSLAVLESSENKSWLLRVYHNGANTRAANVRGGRLDCSPQ